MLPRNILPLSVAFKGNLPVNTARVDVTKIELSQLAAKNKTPMYPTSMQYLGVWLRAGGSSIKNGVRAVG